MEVAALGVAGGVHELFNYNRENFHYDRELRFKKELQLWDFRNDKVKMWRDDIREVIGITERRMDSYLLVSVLLLDSCVALLCEGRMEPGTPAFLLDFYLMSLGGAFTYLFLSVWLGMHAMVVAQCTSARLLTMYVRLPVPTWALIEGMRSYGAEIEQQGIRSTVMRVPFVGNMARKAGNLLSSKSSRKPEVLRPGHSSSEDGEEVEGDKGAAHVLGVAEAERHREDIYELLRTPTASGEHVRLARQASRYYECYDAFTRVSMLFGANQLLNALAYFSVGYCSVQDRVLTGSWVIVAIALAIAAVLVEVDITLSRLERTKSQLLIFIGPVSVTCATYAWLLFSVEIPWLVSVGYASHGLWLLFAASKLKVLGQHNGAFLPVKFRPILYLNIFEWIKRWRRSSPDPTASGSSKRHYWTHVASGAHLSSDEADAEDGSTGKSWWSNETAPLGCHHSPPLNRGALEEKGPKDAGAPAGADALHEEGFFDFSATFPRYGVAGPVMRIMGHPGKVPWKLFRLATLLLVCLWGSSLLRPMWMLGLTGRRQTSAEFVAAAELGEGERIVVGWPGHPGFTPRALSCDWSGNRLLVADDFGLYAATLEHGAGESVAVVPGGDGSAARRAASLSSTVPQFKHVPACKAVEGKAMLDADIICHSNGHHESCQALILSGQNLTACPFLGSEGAHDDHEQPRTWRIAGDWLDHSDEKLQSAAAGGDCASEPLFFEPAAAMTARGRAATAGRGGHTTVNELGCVVVGTSSGRIVQLRPHMGEAKSLVPDRNLVAPSSKSPGTRGALHAHRRSVLVLQPSLGLLRAVGGDPTSTNTTSWRLPSDVEWHALSAGGGRLYLLGSRDGDVELWRFPLPSSLDEPSNSDEGAPAQLATNKVSSPGTSAA
eukprot:TRINITY_DN28347_c0_g2_i1.p1 TRINITY_DN28347_c0_g2~~TRINITY_DN28347_c0_g2_i1.p1  ORF type:complete len:890 (-),score=152.82 TRINITY_DN28347_c0_g2_i1:54-2723(-)